MPTITIDPRDFISPPFEDCPHCGAKELGVIAVGPYSLTRRCRKCMKLASEPLPALKKVVVYLDQFVISNMVKAIKEDAPGHNRLRNRDIWIRMYELIDVLVRAQVLVCPQFENHLVESMQAGPLYEGLERFYQYVSGGVSLESSEKIKRGQMAEAAAAWLEGRAPCFDDVLTHAIEGRVDSWGDRLRIAVRLELPDSMDEFRKVRSEVHEGLKALFGRWRAEKARTFSELYEEQLREFGRAYLDEYARWFKSATGALSSSENLDIKTVLPSDAVTTVNLLEHFFVHRGVPREVALGKVVEFMRSDALMGIPYVQISAALWAAIASNAAAGQKAPPNRGTFADINAVAAAAPVCDVMVIDAPFEALINHIPKRHRPAYRAKIYSTHTIPTFIDYLADLLARIPQQHRDLLSKAYGDSWDKPNWSIFKS